MLLKLDILSREKKGNVFLYKLNADNFILKQFKIFENLLGIQNLIAEIQKYCHQIILFGSCSDGSNGKKSDVDLFIQTEYKKEVRKIVNKYLSADVKYQAIIQDSLEAISTRKENSALYQQIKKGIVLWKGKPDYEEV